MPVDITSVHVEFGHEIKREEYGPKTKSTVSLNAAVDKGEDGVVAMNYLATLCRAKVAEMLGLPLSEASQAALGAANITRTGPVTATEVEANQPAGERRTRRTKAQIEADEAAAAAAKAPAQAPAPAAAAEGGDAGDWSDASPQAQAPPATSAASPASPPAADEWNDAAPAAAAAAPITDQDLAKHCSTHSTRLGGREKVKEVITSFRPADWSKETFGVGDIPQEVRAAFVTALEAKS